MRKLDHLLSVAGTLCLIAAFQDFLGLEGYIDHVREFWVSTPWPLEAIAGAACFAAVMGAKS